MGLTSSGFSGFNNTEAEDLGPFDSLVFFIKHEWRYNKDGSGSLVLAANYAYRCALYDLDDTVVTQDFVMAVCQYDDSTPPAVDCPTRTLHL